MGSIHGKAKGHLEGMDRVTENIWIGNCTAGAKVVLGSDPPYTKQGITHVLDVSDKIHYTPDEKQHKVKVLKAGMSDYGRSALNEKHLKLCFNYMKEAIASGSKVLVHCHVGINRSATIVIAYLMKTRGYSLERALKFVRQNREVEPAAYVKKLKGYEKQLVNEGVIDVEKERQAVAKLSEDKEADAMLALAGFCN
mmetsp:Transcript_2853/g.6653  ORF Transcript_2853/g.6653 Transcript_2853/m.6653 type:complete len:196 (+) Transcript_2853:86-673(+)|eukprot:CAMPEP_0114488614 /NCGR_PEP_ID=MMETSP0109-20121206/1429_1 /TAXON_ID=29199 /ORGANISM="Chlorarachnion reptans, Strain CCCM449" /LENGTH=195 /DNA_ID=CAMNT_0001665029 /DNA_START=82 /DNA_END=669 /DNA_ORIENTATION=+